MDLEDNDDEMEQFAEQAIKKEMKRLNGEVSEEDEDQEVLEELEKENSEEGDFFEGEELSEVDLEGSEEI